MGFDLQMLCTYMDASLCSYVEIDGLNLAQRYYGRRALNASDQPGDLSAGMFNKDVCGLFL